MPELYLAAALALLLMIAAGLARVLQGPTPADCMLAAQLFGTTGVAMILLLAFAVGVPRLLDVALVFALLAAVLGIAFVARGWADPSAMTKGRRHGD